MGAEGKRSRYGLPASTAEIFKLYRHGVPREGGDG
jgi:hypothetical protein